MYRKYISLIAIFVALAALIISAMLILARRSVTPSPTPQAAFNNANSLLPPANSETSYPTEVTPDWETYTNTRFGYSIKYPPFWATIINVSPTTKGETLQTATSLDIFDSAAQKSYPDGVMTIQVLAEVPNIPGKKEGIILNGISVQKFSADEQNLHRESYLIPQLSGFIKIDVRFSPGDQIQQTFAAMLNTFQLNK